MAKFLQRFVRHLEHLSDALHLLKQFCCPFCGAAETLNCHSKLYGNNPDSTRLPSVVQRGQRVWCCNRGQRGGCGRSFSIFLADVLPRHTVTGRWLWGLLKRLLGGGSIKSAFESLGPPFALNTQFIICCTGCESAWQRCAQPFVGSKSLPPARRPIHCSKRPSICKASLARAIVRPRVFSSTFSARSWSSSPANFPTAGASFAPGNPKPSA